MSPTTADTVAEITVVAAAIDSCEGSDLAHQRLEPHDFADPVLRRLFTVTPQLPTTRTTPIEDGTLMDLRADTAARLANVHRDDLNLLLTSDHGRQVLVDTAGSYARRVLNAARRRRLLAAAHDLPQLISSDDPDTALDLVYALAGTLSDATDGAYQLAEHSTGVDYLLRLT